MSQSIRIKDSTVNINPPTQQQLNLESRTNTIGYKVTDSEKKYLEKLARHHGIGVSTLSHRIIFKYLKLLPLLRQLETNLDEFLI